MIQRRRRALVALASLPALAVLLFALWLRWPQSVPTFDQVRDAYQPSEAFLLDRHGRVLDSERINFGVRRFAWVPLADVSPALVDAVIAGEDRRFLQHGGVDVRAVLAALRDGVLRQRWRGASTISMQLAWLLHRQRDGDAPANRRRSWRDKLEQVRMAWSLEASWSKSQIFEAYLNLLSYRGEWQGIGAASFALAGKAPSGLTTDESEVLAALLPAPSSGADRVARRACARAQLRDAQASCVAIEQAAERLLSGPRESRTSVRLAPHLARSLLRVPGERLQTTLDRDLQRLTLDRLRLHLAGLADRNVRDGAALIIDNQSGEVLAYVASGGPNSRAAAVDGIRAHRQAGSTLKPFLYELAIEQGYLTAASLLDDSPISLDTASGAYLPQNYDRDFKGLVSARTALASSLNIPAVRTLVLTGVESFRDRLVALGYDGITEDGAFYGYSLALGSAEVSLWEQAQAFRTLARGGLWSPLRVLPLEPAEALVDSRRVLSEDAAFVVGDMLSDRAARVLTFGLGSHLNTPFWSAVKTGTSKDMRDNWCIGFSDRYTVAVWVGNFEGDAMQGVSGVTGAGPVWNELMSALHAKLPSKAPTPPAGVAQQAVSFANALEPPRNEWFLNGTGMQRMTPVAHREPRIDSPPNGLIIALDPDIPERLQRVRISASDGNDQLRLKLNGNLLGSAATETLWRPIRGSHQLELQDPQGKVLDRVLFTVR